MQLIKKVLITLFVSFSFLFALNAQADSLSPVGYWKTISDRTHQPAGIVMLWVSNGELKGKIVKIFDQDGNKPTDLCKNCKGERHNKPIQGMVILWGMQEVSDGVWKNGQILDPKVGKTYHCSIRVDPGNQKLFVRGYIGLPLLGRTQNWYRVSSPEG